MKTNPLFLTRHLDGATFRYKPQHGIDGGFLSEWEPLYEASTVKADADKLKAFQSGVPVGSKYDGNQVVGASLQERGTQTS